MHTFVFKLTQAYWTQHLADIQKANSQLQQVDITTNEFDCHVSDDKVHAWSHGLYTMHLKDGEGSEFKQETVRFTNCYHRKKAQDSWKLSHMHVSQARKEPV
jgi:ketosteroid isomerase-like protein